MEPSNQLELNIPRCDTLYDAIRRRPAPERELMRVTGWTPRELKPALLKLIAAGRVACKPAYGAGEAVYRVTGQTYSNAEFHQQNPTTEHSGTPQRAAPGRMTQRITRAIHGPFPSRA